MTKYRSLDLQDGAVICALTALDTDLNQFHALCMEQGPFFKVFFSEFATDAHRKGLHQSLPRQPAHVSHHMREYWRPQIEKKQILAIRELFTKFQAQWREMCAFHTKKFFPAAEASTASALTTLNTQFTDLATNICAICSEITDTKDLFLPGSVLEPEYTVTVIHGNARGVSVNNMLHSLLDLSDE